MEIFNKTPAISEDTIIYRLYPVKSQVPDKASATTLAACIHALVDSLLPADFLWHRDTFEIKVVNENDKEWILEGRMRVGDCVDDEWCVVWLLREISSKWDLAISVNDSDGEFLLIEAAERLPAWVKPTNSENRVWIYNSQLHLIDLSHVSSPSKIPRRRRVEQDSDDEDDAVEDFLAVDDALKALRDPLIDTVAPSGVKEIIWQRISKYPSAAREHVHYTKVYIPLDIARALYVKPSLVQKATEAFYTRDAIQLRSAHRMQRFQPNTSVLSSVRTTRTAYAQLLGQKFYPPKIFGRWEEREGTKEWRWRDVGMKIAVGFEILFQESKGRSETINSSAEGLKSLSDSIRENLQNNSDYQSYRKNLESLGYYKGEMQGSQLWNNLENKAISVFLESQKQDESSRPSFAALVASSISQSPETLPDCMIDEDDDSWLNIDAADFESALATAGSEQAPNAMDTTADNEPTQIDDSDRAAAQQASRLKDLAAKVEEFVEGEGDMDGARFKDELFSDEEEVSDSDDDEDRQQNEETRQADMDKLIPALDPLDYGKMPASFYGNSQKVSKPTEDTEALDNNAPPPTSAPRESPSKPIRKPILPRDRFDGVDSDDETDEEDEEMDEEDQEDQPQVVGDIEVDMEEEEEEFLEFSRQALGISDDQWKSILSERKDRGAYVPKASGAFQGHPSIPKADVEDAGGAQTRNPNLDSFEALMKAMDDELRHTTQPSTQTSSNGKGKEKAKYPASADEEDVEAMMSEELQAILERDDVDEEGELGDAGIDYNLIKNFLESFKSQGGLSGPVSSLAGRLQPDWKLPRDDAGGST